MTVIKQHWTHLLIFTFLIGSMGEARSLRNDPKVKKDTPYKNLLNAVRNKKSTRGIRKNIRAMSSTDRGETEFVNKDGSFKDIESFSTKGKLGKKPEEVPERDPKERTPDIKSGEGEGASSGSSDGRETKPWQAMCFAFSPAMDVAMANDIINQFREGFDQCGVVMEALPFEVKDMPAGINPNYINERSMAGCNEEHLEEKFLQKAAKDSVKAQSYPPHKYNADVMCGKKPEDNPSVAGCAAKPGRESIVDIPDASFGVSAHEYLHNLGGVHCAEIQPPEVKVPWGYGICEPTAKVTYNLENGLDDIYFGPAYPRKLIQSTCSANGGAEAREGPTKFTPHGCAAILGNSVPNDGSHKYDPSNDMLYNPAKQREYKYSRDTVGGKSFLKPGPSDELKGAGGYARIDNSSGGQHGASKPKGFGDGTGKANNSQGDYSTKGDIGPSNGEGSSFFAGEGSDKPGSDPDFFGEGSGDSNTGTNNTGENGLASVIDDNFLGGLFGEDGSQGASGTSSDALLGSVKNATEVGAQVPGDGRSQLDENGNRIVPGGINSGGEGNRDIASGDSGSGELGILGITDAGTSKAGSSLDDDFFSGEALEPRKAGSGPASYRKPRVVNDAY